MPAVCYLRADPVSTVPLFRFLGQKHGFLMTWHCCRCPYGIFQHLGGEKGTGTLMLSVSVTGLGCSLMQVGFPLEELSIALVVVFSPLP